MKSSTIFGLLIIASILFFTKTETGKQFWFDVFRTFSNESSINCSNKNVVATLYKVLKDNEVKNPSVTGISTTVDKVKYKKCTALLSADIENLFGVVEQVKNLPIEYEVQVTDDEKNFIVFVKEK